MYVVRKLLRMAPVENDRLPTVEILRRTPLGRLDETVRVLKQRRPAAEVRQALIEVISTAPLSHFETLKQVFITHCADAG